MGLIIKVLKEVAIILAGAVLVCLTIGCGIDLGVTWGKKLTPSSYYWQSADRQTKIVFSGKPRLGKTEMHVVQKQRIAGQDYWIITNTIKAIDLNSAFMLADAWIELKYVDRKPD